MSYTKTKAIEFWYQLDHQTHPVIGRPVATTLEAYEGAFGRGEDFSMDRPVDIARDSITVDEKTLEKYISGKEVSFIALAQLQQSIFDEYFPEPDDLRMAFEDFGHGVLHDNKRNPESGNYRRPNGAMNHMMDGSPDSCIGYHRWHAFIRCAVLSGAPSSTWLHINRCVGLAWAIYSELAPEKDSPSNPKLESGRVRVLRDFWMNASEDLLNAAFLSYQGNFPENYGSRRARDIDEIGFERVRLILNAAAGSGSPHHDGHARFWNLPLSEFSRTPIYGNLPIASPGTNRGQRSALVRVLKGELENMGRMPPFPRPPVSPENISFIENWIDELRMV